MMDSDRSREYGPPRLAELLLRLTVRDADASDGLLGDLREELAELRENGQAPSHPRLWFWFAIFGLSGRFLLAPAARVVGLSRSPIDAAKDRGHMMESFVQSLGFAIRALRRRPGFTAAAVLTLALGIGANAAMFSVVETVVLTPLPFESPDRVVQVLEDRLLDEAGSLSGGNFRQYQTGNEVFSHFAGIADGTGAVLRDEEGRFTRMPAAYVSSDLFEMMGVVPTLGRTFRADEDVDGAGNVVLIAHGYWLSEFGGEDVIGRTISLQRSIRRIGFQRGAYEIIGVLPPDFRIPPVRARNDYGALLEPDLILPFGLDSRMSYGYGVLWVRALAQLREGVTAEQAQANLQSIVAGIAEPVPEWQAGLEVAVVPVGEVLRQEYGLALGFLWAATALVLLVACASVSSLLLGWGVAREQELAVRAALGAGARRIFRQLITEATVLAGAACVLGVLLAYWGIAALKIFAPDGVHRLDQISLDVGVLWFTVGISLASVLLVGLWPALRGARLHSNEVLKAGGRGATITRTRSLRVLVTGEVALSLVLLAGAGLMLQSFWNLVGVDTGFESQRFVQIDLDYIPNGLSKYEEGPRNSGPLFELIENRLEAIPGVRAVARSNHAPLEGFDPGGYDITIAGRPHPPKADRVRATQKRASHRFFQALGIELLEGRLVYEERRIERRNARRAGAMGPRQQVVISESMAKAFWPGESAVGEIFYPGEHDPDAVSPDSPDYGGGLEVMGVVADLRHALERQPVPTYYTWIDNGRIIHVRTSVDPAGLVGVLRREMDAVDPDEIKVRRIRTGEQLIAEQSADSRFRAQIVVLFAVLAVGITCLGLFGVLTYAVAQRTRELGVRMTLGAARSDIAALVLNQGARMAGLGIAIGLVIVFWVTRFVSGLLFGVQPLDPIALVGGAALIFGLALFAAYLPARRAMGVDPIEALRHG